MQHLRWRHTQARFVLLLQSTRSRRQTKRHCRVTFCQMLSVCLFFFFYFPQPLQINLNLSFQSAAPVWHVSELRTGTRATSNWTTTSDCVVWKRTVFLCLQDHSISLLYFIREQMKKQETHIGIFKLIVFYYLQLPFLIRTYKSQHGIVWPQLALELQWRDAGFCHM